jgi:hypothetical protein
LIAHVKVLIRAYCIIAERDYDGAVVDKGENPAAIRTHFL